MIRSHIKKLQDFTVFTGAGHKIEDHMCNILLPLRLLDQKPVSVTMIPGTGSRLALLLLTMSAALFGWKLPDGALRFFPCVSDYSSLIWQQGAETRRRRGPGTSCCLPSHNSLKIVHSCLAGCRAKWTRTHKSVCPRSVFFTREPLSILLGTEVILI